MVESLRVLGLLLHKNWLTRKRQWLMSLVGEILLPIGIIAAVWAVRGLSAKPPVHISTESHYRPQNLTELIDQLYNERNNSVRIFYAPNNTFPNELMRNVEECFMNKSSITGFNSESEFVSYYYKHFQYINGMAVIFDDDLSDSSKNLNYKLRGTYMGMTGLYNAVPPVQNMTYYYTKSHSYTQVQICVDESFVKMKGGDNIPEMFIQQVPYPPYTLYDAGDAMFRMVMGMLLVTAFFIPLFIETSKATSEKFLGINVLMSMNGISNSINLFSWLISGILFLSVFCVIPILVFFIMPVGDGLPYLNYGNPFLLFLVFAAYVGHLLAYGVHVSSYFSRSLLVMFALLILNVLTMVLKLYAFNEDTNYLVPYVGIILPNLLLHQAMEELSYYEGIAEGIQWKNLFVTGNAAYKLGGSVGMILILSVIGMIFHFVLAIYVYAVNPGRYGVRKSPLFFLKFNKKVRYEGDKVENLSYDDMSGKPFEPTPGGIYKPGIQLRNLTKAYRISLFNSEKVHALKIVSVDFYKGQITSLLGHNGAGKTTMMSILTGMMSPTDGMVLINSKDMAERSSEIMNDMGLCTQENMLFPSLTVIEQLEFFAKLKRKDKAASVVKEEVKAFLHKLKLYEKRHALPKQLSGGQKRRVCLGMALVGDSSTLILDEPTSGLDPESRRVIWDILLKMRGQKTILISTHDMEEADILGDRIAILHSGQLRSFGTSLFLKKLIGQGNVEVTLSVEPDCDPQKICAALACEGISINKEGSKIVLSIPYTPQLPDQLDTLESKKKELGVSGFSVSLISLEQVFLKVTRENDGPLKPRQTLTEDDEKLRDSALHMQSVRALLAKKLTYTMKNLSIVLLKLFTVFMALLAISLILKQASVSTQMDKKVIPVSLDMYNNPETYYTSYNKTYGDEYKNITQSLRGKATEITDSNLTSAMIKYAKTDLANYENHLVAAAEFNETKENYAANAFYSNKATFSLPLSVNLIWNTIIKTILGDEYSINLSSQELPNTVYSDMTMMNGIITSVVFVFQFCSTLALFVIHPLRESSRGVKQLQRMTGVSGFTYWGTMFVFDFAMYLVIVWLIVVGFLMMDYFLELQVYGVKEIFLVIFLLCIFAVNTLPFVYIFSFSSGKTSMVVRLLTYIPLGIVTVELVMYSVGSVLSDYESVRIIRAIQKGVFLLVPYVSFFHSQMSFYLTAQVNARCVKMPNEFYDSRCSNVMADTCCSMGCYNGTCKNYKDYFTKFEEDITLEESLIYLCLTPVIYFGILALLEAQYIEKIVSRFKNQIAQEIDTADEQVRREKSTISQKIQALNGRISNGANYLRTDSGFNEKSLKLENTPNDQVFLVYDLQKSYKKLTAVKDVSFGVNRHECFGLLGVNGAGKSTTFRMMTGGEVPDNGTMYIGGKDIRNNRNYFLSQMGYCPQQDAIIKSLNSYDHLRLFARLRGIPEDKVEHEVQAWIERLNLTACAVQPSGTYSGGNKRRLNIAMALIGNPNLVLMDEPTTGVDPGARRSLWNVIKSCQMAGQAVVLTSHSMEECEALCDRLAIMVAGKFVCIGASEELKQRFGAGYDIQIRMDPGRVNDQLEHIKDDMTDMLDVELTDENLGYLMYHVAPNYTTWRRMYDVMNEMKSKYDCIEDFSVLSSSLEELFLLFARAANRRDSQKSMII